VYPRKKTFQGKLIVLVGHWTGSMGEGMAIGFDSFKKPLVVGTKMAGLLGAIEGFNLKETNINFQIPTERLIMSTVNLGRTLFQRCSHQTQRRLGSLYLK
jgi:carboxyl-terminal processing protease